MTTRIILPLLIISQNNLRTWIIRVSTITEKLSYVFDVLLTAAEFVLAAGVVDSYEEGFLSH